MIALGIVVLMLINTMSTPAQLTESMQLPFSSALIAVRQAQEAGATPNEIAPLIGLLNKALELQTEALDLRSPAQSSKRAELLSQMDQILSTVATQGSKLTRASLEREQTNQTIAYILGAVAALLGSLFYALAVSSYKRRRIKRILNMRVSGR